ncbi:MAG TPA: hypothetical protein VGG39_31785 [Polyangiaceae bacterium]|jgi:hypothetical protein
MRVGLGLLAVPLLVSYACGGASTPPPNSQLSPIGDPLATPADQSVVALSASAAASASAAGPAASTAPTSAPSAGAATVLAKELHAPNAVALDKTNVYWVDEIDGDVARAPKRGGTVMTVYGGTGQAFGANSSIAIDDTDVYWTSQIDKTSSLTRQDKNGGKPTVVTSSTIAVIECVAIDDAAMYWVLGGGIVKESKKGGAPQALGGGFKGADCIAVDGDHVYWSLSGTPEKQFADGGIVEALKTGANQRLLVKGADHAANVKADGQAVYWQSGPKVFKSDKAKGEAVKLAEASGPVADIAIDDRFVYFLTPDALARVPKEGGRGETLVDGLKAPSSVAVDATGVYFTTKGTEAAKWRDGTLQRVDK